jgi:predicted nucleic acid-binding protein
MAIALFDTNILIDFLKGYQPAIDEIEYWDDAVISAITGMELMAGAKSGDDDESLAELLGNFRVIHTDDHIMSLAAPISRASIQLGPKIALPDTIIMATGQLCSDMIITRNKKDFRLLRNSGKLRIPYELANTDPVSFINVIHPSLIRSYEPTRKE